MKKITIVFLNLFLAFLVTSCFWNRPEDAPPPTFPNQYTPVIIDRTILESSVVVKPIQAIVKSGKIYIKDNLMYLNDVNKGFHIYDYSNAANPVKIGYINILGATDLAIRNNSLYINQATDLVTLSYNFSNNSIEILNRDKNVFPQKKSPNGINAATLTANQIVIDWNKN